MILRKIVIVIMTSARQRTKTHTRKTRKKYKRKHYKVQLSKQIGIMLNTGITVKKKEKRIQNKNTEKAKGSGGDFGKIKF